MNRQSDKKISKETTRQIRIDYLWHKQIKRIAAERGVSMRHIIEEVLGDYYSIDA